MKNIKWLGVLGVTAAFFPTTVSAYETPIEDNEVQIMNIVNHFSGEHKMERDENDGYYNEYIFDGHIIQMYSEQSVLWVDGEVVPYITEEVDGVYLPQSYRVKGFMKEPTIPVEVFERYLDYEVKDEYLIFDERPEKKPEDEQEADGADVETEEELTIIEEENTVEDTTKPEEEKTILKKDKKENPNQDTTQDLTSNDKEESKEPERKVKELGHINFEVDLKNYGLHLTLESGLIENVNGQTFTAFFENENTLQINHKDQHQIISLTDGIQKDIQFENEVGDFYLVSVKVIDSRKDGLNMSTVIPYVKKVNQDIIIHSGDNTVNLTFEHEDPSTLSKTLSELEQVLSFLGIQQFGLEKEEGKFLIDFHLHDSNWSI